MTQVLAPVQTVQAPTPPPAAPPPSGPVVKAVPRWAIHRRLYDWTLSFAEKKSAAWWLAFISFIESIFFPIPTLVLQVPMTLARPKKAWSYAFNCTVSSVLGGIVGYGLGYLFHGLAEWLFGAHAIDGARRYLTDNVVVLTGGAIAVHPFKVFTIVSGALHVALGPFIIACIIGRAVLFYAVAALLWFFGPPVKVFIEKYFNLLTVVFGVLLIGVVVVFKVL